MVKSDPVYAGLGIQARRNPAKLAIRVVGRETTSEVSYAQLTRQGEQWSQRLADLGVEAGDRVVFMGANSPSWVAAYLGVAATRGTVVPLDAKLSEAQLRALIERIEPRLIVADREHAARVSALPTEAVRVDLADGSLLPGSPARLPLRADDLDPEIGLIVFTSGSTAEPKGVMLSRENLRVSIDGGIAGMSLGEDSEVLCVLPMHHVLGCGMTFSPLVAGGGVTYLEELAGDLLLRAMQMSRTTMLPGPPRLFELLLTRIHAEIAKLPGPARAVVRGLQGVSGLARAQLGVNIGKVVFAKVHEQMGGQLEMMVAGGAALPGAIARGLEELGFFIVQGYGLTETCAVVSVNTRDAHRAGSVGRAMVGCEVQIHNPDVSGRGEILVRGGTIMRGYYRDPEATAAVLDDQGWLRTGDLGWLDKDGFLYINGRIKELIVTAAGKNVSPGEVELQYRGVAGVEELAVVGLPSTTRHGEEVHAAVVLSAGANEQSAREAIAARSRDVASYQRIQRLHVVEQIPRTSSLKVRYGQLRDELVRGRGPVASTSSTRSASLASGRGTHLDQVTKIVRSVAGDAVVQASSSLVFDLGLDSMAQVELTARLGEELGRPVDLGVIRASKTVADLATALLDQPSASTGQRGRVQVPPERGFVAQGSLDLVGGLCQAAWGLRAEGVEHLPERGQMILCPNHESHLDVVFVAACLPPALRARLCAFAKQEHFDSLPTRAAARWIRAVPVDRIGDPQAALDAGRALLEAGQVLLIHPEGTRTRTGELGVFRRGAAHVAIQTGAPLVPVHIDGAFEIFPPHRRLPRLDLGRPGLVVRFGRPLTPSPGRDPALQERELTAALRRAVVELEAR